MLGRKINEIEFCVDNNISQHQYNFLFLLYTVETEKRLGEKIKPEIEKLLKIFIKYKEWANNKKLLNDDKITELVTFGFMRIKNDKGTLGSYELTPKFLNVFINHTVAINELWETYPPFANSDNGMKTFPLKGANKEVIGLIYWKSIEGNYEEHLKVIKDIKYGVSHKYIKQSIKSFIEGELYKDIRKLRLSGKGKKGVLVHAKKRNL